ncbi:hypothetical protein [Neolewinella sp.]|uniref:hypothetical protein n=1 Tax=Neolewinella sp. TaxID=2993543 RepID=UPI003B515880
MRLLLLLLFVLVCTCVRAQRVLLFEKLTSSKSERVYEGDMLRFRMKGDKFWQEGYIREMRPDIQALVINDRYVLLDEIESVYQGNTIATKLGYGLITFGAGWSVFAALGYATDKDPSTSYSVDDALVTATSVGAGYLLIKVLGTRKFRPGKFRRLRIVDISF